MSNVTLSIGGRAYTVACADGEEAHVAGLGKMIDAKIAAMDATASQHESRALLFAALLLADEVHEAKADLPAAQSAPAPGDLAPQLARIAERLENLADRLEG